MFDKTYIILVFYSFLRINIITSEIMTNAIAIATTPMFLMKLGDWIPIYNKLEEIASTYDGTSFCTLSHISSVLII